MSPDPDPLRELAPLAEELERAARARPEVRSALRRVLAWLTELVAEPAQPPPPASPGPTAPQPTLPLVLGSARVEVPVAASAKEAEALRTAIESRARVEQPPTPAPTVAARAQDLAVVGARCKLQAEACRWAVVRRRRQEEGAPLDQAIKPTDKELARRARALPDCALWALDPYASLPGDAELEDLAAGYENLASAVDLARETRADEEFGPEALEAAYALLAEALSALRFGLEDRAGRTHDADQLVAFQWLKARTYEDQIYVARHMRLDDPADPTLWLDRQQRIADLRARFEARRQHARRRQELLNKIRFHARLIERAEAAQERGEDWRKIESCLDELVEAGMKPSDPEARELLLPLLERMPGDFEPSAAFERVLLEADRYLASREAAEPDAPPPRPRSAELDAAARLVRGKVALLIGGHERRRSREALEQDLGLAQLRWITTDPHEPVASFEPEIARRDTGLVLLAIRWSSHSYAGIKEFCKRHGKPFVRLPRGYGSNQVAHEILQQVSGQLGE